ncbi:1-phosphatidylinositol phosphodiesterase-like [Protopterus annectens]|uniref:1-phosphatidylinositol phosphodiesterase-like n=1 Tax=Protopterus annectens TaxID=7888 RepID=UPI001CFABD89|nr:1-phosphatidylinositol phosphodiesterase-like [Protopterus annectens]XP_043935291.1 1-phosphatidylinositol phosphodiesterase-like [Protopterus annectens]
MGNINAKDPDYWNVPDGPPPESYNECWMKSIPDDKKISQLSFPGTHNTMARAGDLLWVWCQSLSLNTQMRLGVRFFDIRCRHYYDSLPIHHGAFYQGCDFNYVVSQMISYLEVNPSEVFLMRIREEHEPDGNTRSFTDTLKAEMSNFPPGRFYLQDHIPNMRECRGKIIVLRDFSDYSFGIHFRSTDLEDTWSAGEDEKWDKVKAQLDKAQQSSGDTLFITFSSFTCGGQAPRELSRKMNPKLHSYITGRKGRLGIVVSDYPGPKLIRDIIESN